jgi:hypothetical protein
LQPDILQKEAGKHGISALDFSYKKRQLLGWYTMIYFHFIVPLLSIFMKTLWHLFTRRLPAREDLFRLFLVVSVPIHIWAWIIILYDIPGYSLYFNIWQQLPLLSYVLVYTLFESIAATLVIAILVWLLPIRINPNGYSLQGSVYLLVAAWLAVFVHMQRTVVTSLALTINVYRVLIVFVLFASLAILVSLSWALRRQPKIATRMLAFIERMNTLAIVYLALDGIAVCITAIRLLAVAIT